MGSIITGNYIWNCSDIWSIASHAVLAIELFNGIASTHLECWSIKVKIYGCPCQRLELIGPIKSTLTTWNGTSGCDTREICALSFSIIGAISH